MNPARLEWQIRCEFNACCKRTLRNELIDACRVAVLFFNMTEVEIAEAMKSAIKEALQYIMGQSSINMTLNYYAHAISDSALAEMDRLIA